MQPFSFNICSSIQYLPSGLIYAGQAEYPQVRDMFKDIDLIEYHVDAITGGTDAFIDVIIKLQQGDKVVSARGTEPDIINASVKAYIAGVNRLLRD